MSKIYNRFITINILVYVSLMFYMIEVGVPAKLELYFSILFVFDFILSFALAKSKKDYVTSFNGIVDIISMFGSFLKVLRLFRLFKLDKEFKVITSFKLTVKEKKEHLIELNMFLLITLVICSYVLMTVEPATFGSLSETLYYCVICISTVGFGDILPTVPITRVVTVIIIVVGQAIFIIDLLIISNGIIKHRNINVE